MKRSGKWFFLFGCRILLLMSMCVPDLLHAEVVRIEYHGWKDCYQITSGKTKVIIAPSVGGRILNYSLDDVNMMWLDSSLYGVTLKKKKKYFHPGGYQLDVLPFYTSEMTGHSVMWVGEYDIKVTGPYSLQVKSSPETERGLQLMKEISMVPSTGGLIIDQRIVNCSDKKIAVSHWGRTFSAAPCFVFFPLNKQSHLPEGWGTLDLQGKQAGSTEKLARHSQWQVKDNIMIIDYQGESGQIVADSDGGWVGWVSDDLVYVKHFEYFPGGRYFLNNCAISVFTGKKPMVEIEVISPERLLKPGQSYLFQERWSLLRHSSKVLNKEDVVKLAQTISKSGL